MPAPTASLSLLHRADGSATYTSAGYTVVGAVNGPVEVQRRDEIPEEAALEVNVRPASGIGTTRERHIESVLHTTLRQILLVRQFPRSLIQLTLQIVGVPENSHELYTTSYLPLLPPLLTTAVLTLLSANLPLCTTITAALVAISETQDSEHKPNIINSPTAQNIASATSLHVFGFTGEGKLLLSESEGGFDIEAWNQAYEVAENICIGGNDDEGIDVDAESKDLKKAQWLRGVVSQKVEKDQRWRTAGQG